MNKALAIGLILITGAINLQAADPVSEYVRKPEVMSLYIGGFDSTCYEITYDGRVLKYYEAPMFKLQKAKGEVIEPSDEQWQAFFKELDAIKIWSWKPEYKDRNIEDGTSWRAVVVYSAQGDYEVVSYGSNAYPQQFEIYLAAVRKLVGDRKFQ